MPDVSREQFLQKVMGIVKGRFPLVKLARAVESPFALRLNGHVASLENVFRMSQLRPDETQHHVERWAVELLRASEGTPDQDAPFEQVKERVLPMVLSNIAFPDEDSDDDESIADATDVAIGGDLSDSAKGVITQPFVGGLHIAYALDNDRTISYISRKSFTKWKMSVDDLHAIAIENLVARSQEIAAHAAQDEDGRVNLILFQTMDGFDASRVLLPSLHQRLREHLGASFVAAMPNRDILLCFRNDEETVDRLRGQVKNDFQSMPHPVTDRLLLITADGVASRD